MLRCPMCTQPVVVVSTGGLMFLEHHYSGMKSLLAKRVPPSKWTTKCFASGAEITVREKTW